MQWLRKAFLFSAFGPDTSLSDSDVDGDQLLEWIFRKMYFPSNQPDLPLSV